MIRNGFSLTFAKISEDFSVRSTFPMTVLGCAKWTEFVMLRSVAPLKKASSRHSTRKVEKAIKNWRKAIQKAETIAPQYMRRVPGWKQSLIQQEQEQQAIIEDPAYSNKVRLVNASKFNCEKMDSYLQDKSSLPRGLAEYAFNKAFSVHWALYRAEHGGMKVSHSDCWRILEIWETKIVPTVSNAHGA
jgi:hypothetical protein